MKIPVLKIKDANGNLIPINAIRGDKGKSAYEQAQEGGYKGTEAEFINLLNGLTGKEISLEDTTLTYEEASELETLTSGEKLSIAFGKIKKAITEFISHLSDTKKHITTNEDGGVSIGDVAVLTGGGVSVGTGAALTGAGGAVGKNAESAAGGAVGKSARTLAGGAVGWDTYSASGGAVGNLASTVEGGAVGEGADSADGGAVGYTARATSGGAVGKIAETTSGGAVGYFTLAQNGGGAVGEGASSNKGFSGGYNATSLVNSIQLGEGENTNEKTLQIYNYQLMNADGKIPAERLPKPSGSYSGSGTTEDQTIQIGGIGDILLITSSNNDIAFVYSSGAHSFPNNGSDFSVKASNAKFENGVLTLINNSYAGLNASGITYHYQVL